ncbi:uncharacterized protein K452DRAFT_235356 [Aplosporella prunicola CBS 121167]|uniref:GED domain-containing protein n=1 Tax=Aplosporella prunicola CBS 121167 TaxID=1176127 RepID=A0A6A6B0U2_9PEZI|nr:uncharacterized protein K452DRAFT_235356 [Aplosporella prunicola CBS 121167]KAF2137802.1 hypothetical protein K452DRAFT_235356 [Aplosporella prunicola CBS 121167]
MTKTVVHSLVDPSMLAKIDKLFACNVGHHIDLPQIVVVGDQSSGKSSVLEGLTRLPFPRDSGLCTRFATQITFRRATTKSVSVSVIPGKDALPDHVETIRAWKKTDIKKLDKDTFADIMREAQEVMGVSSQGGGPLKTFSSDVLSIEVAGLDKEHFAVIDVPGIFQRVTKDLTTQEDKAFVKSMVGSYMANPRSIMLTVVPANVDPATQLILEMAEEVDKEGQRTLGVLTKPDLVDPGAEANVVDMVEGRSHQLFLGWCLVKNPGQKDVLDPKFDRYSSEEIYFKTQAPWNSLPLDRVGVTSLRERLQELLARHIRQEFPKVKSEVNKKLKECKKSLEKLGPKRDTPAEQSRFLIDIATNFQIVTNKALDAKYFDDCFTKLPDLKIATLVVNRNEELSESFALYGHTYQFKEGWDQEENIEGEINGEEIGEHNQEVKKENGTLSQSKDAEELDDILYHQSKLPYPKQNGILRWITHVYTHSRGFELGQFDPSLLAMTMKAQSKNWDGLALGYISDIVVITHIFINTLLKHVCPNGNVREKIKSVLMENLVERYQKAFEHVRFILEVERLGVAEKKSFSHSCYSNSMLVRLDDIKQTHTMSNKQHTVQELHDILKAYYKVARKRVVDALCMQAATYHLISGPDTPLKLFSPTFVSKLSEEQLDQIAKDDTLVKRRRTQLMKEIEDLEKGRKILS